MDDVTEYVAACRQLGYQHPDLTAHAAQIAEWYGAQAGLDLAALDADIGALRAAATAADDVVHEQAATVATLYDGWAGTGAGAAFAFLARHQRAAESVVAEVRIAADALDALREDLWRAVDAQVSATLETGAAAHRETWLAACRTLTTGAGDRATASEVVDLEVKPFVNNVVGGRWVAAMQVASDAAAAAYDTAVARLSGPGRAVFEAPFDFAPHAPVESRSVESAAAAPMSASPITPAAAVTPSAFSAAPAAPPSMAPTPSPLPAEPSLGMQAPAASTPSLPSLPSLGESGGLGSGGTGFGSGLTDLLGGLSDAGEFEPDATDPQDEDEEEDPEDEDPAPPEEEPEEKEEEPEEDVEEGEQPPVVEPIEQAPEPAPTPPAEPLVAPPPPPPEAAPPPERTPCEIAADELPQVGE